VASVTVEALVEQKNVANGGSDPRPITPFGTPLLLSTIDISVFALHALSKILSMCIV